jgi:hypothetical protein
MLSSSLSKSDGTIEYCHESAAGSTNPVVPEQGRDSLVPDPPGHQDQQADAADERKQRAEIED